MNFDARLCGRETNGSMNPPGQGGPELLGFRAAGAGGHNRDLDGPEVLNAEPGQGDPVRVSPGRRGGRAQGLDAPVGGLIVRLGIADLEGDGIGRGGRPVRLDGDEPRGPGFGNPEAGRLGQAKFLKPVLPVDLRSLKGAIRPL